ncbi:MAG: TonB-dependent receptor [Bacteroidales bacterium]|jgi:TonB-linked SusC/RagA family outer membrane protein|nr:TonB-dependent receptor [Bacteroidales bacterium]
MRKQKSKRKRQEKNTREVFSFLLKFAVAILLIGFVNISTASNYAQNAKLSLSLNNVSLKKVFKEIEKQSDFYFMYNDSKVNVSKKVSIEAEGYTIYELLDQILYDSGIVYEVVDKQIVLNPKQERIDHSSQQTKKVVGTVLDENGSPIPGVNVFVKGTTIGTVTDLEGNYTIQVPSGEVVLVFSFVGFRTFEVKVGEQAVINVTLYEETTQLDEIVVIGYGSSSKKLLTSSIASVNSEDIENNISAGIESALQGKTSGVMINQNSGTPGAAATVQIRGISSISAGTQPLYVVDGIPITSGNYGQINMEGQDINALADINPNNIKSISVLKDASAAAIYGARAGNGVILIETKTGADGDTKFEFNSYYGLQEVYKRLELLNAEDFKDYIVELGVNPSEYDPDTDTDWLDEVLRTAPISNYELSASGANENTKFYISGRYFNQDGVVLGTAYEKYNGRVNIDYAVNDKFDLGAKISTNYSVNDRVRGDQSVNGVLPNAVSTPPVYPVKDELGNYAITGWWDNPVAIGESVTNQAKSFRNISNIYGTYDIIKGLTFKNQWGFDYYSLREKRFEPNFVKSARNDNGVGVDAATEVFKLTQQSTLTYITSIQNNHNFNFLLGYSFEKWDENSSYILGTQFPSNETRDLDVAAIIDGGGTDASSYEAGLESLFGRVKYNYNNKYLIDLSLRRDGSSNFGENNRYAYLPAVSLAWRISEESFLHNSSLISELKLKLSYGLTGNDNIGAFRSLNVYSGGANYYGSPGTVPGQIANPDIKWETTSNTNIGLNIGFFKNRILFSADYYYNHTKDLLLFRVLPGSSGFTTYADNIGELENKGLEFDLNTENLTGNFTWTSNLNISFNRNKILELYGDKPSTPEGRGNNNLIEGEPIGVFYMYKSLGVDPSSGELVFEDVNDDGVIGDEDRQIVGDPNPDFTGGFNNMFSYKNLSMDLFIQFAYGNDIFNGVRQYAENMTISNDNQLVTVKDRWQEPGDITYIPKAGIPSNNWVSSHYIEDGSYLRLKRISVNYDLPQKVIEKLGGYIRSFRIYIRGQNLYTLTPYSGMDPEVNYSGISNVVRGVDFFTYPQVRTYTLGIKMNF